MNRSAKLAPAWLAPAWLTMCLGFLLLGPLAGCETPATKPSFPDIRFTDEPRLRLDVAAVEIENDFHPSFHAPNVEHLFPIPPEHAMENWARDRLEATGTLRRARVRIIDASVKETELPRTKGLTGAFTTDQAERYDASVEMGVDLLNDRGFVDRTISAKATRSQSVAEGITPNQRDKAWYAMTKELMAELDRELERQIRDNFSFYVQ
jgi:hypothetical protein